MGIRRQLRRGKRWMRAETRRICASWFYRWARIDYEPDPEIMGFKWYARLPIVGTVAKQTIDDRTLFEW